MTQQVTSKKRIADHGEVYTRDREVNAMLDLVQQETQRIDSRFLEPACGSGNILIEVLRRKLEVVASRYRKNQSEYERYVFLAVSSLYGIDVLQDNIDTCRNRLLDLVQEKYTAFYKTKTKQAFLDVIRYLVERNILWGDALTMKTPVELPEPIVFAEWSPVNNSLIKRRDFIFSELAPHASSNELSLLSDLGEDAFIPKSVKDYPSIHLMRIADAA